VRETVDSQEDVAPWPGPGCCVSTTKENGTNHTSKDDDDARGTGKRNRPRKEQVSIRERKRERERQKERKREREREREREGGKRNEGDSLRARMLSRNDETDKNTARINDELKIVAPSAEPFHQPILASAPR